MQIPYGKIPVQTLNINDSALYLCRRITELRKSEREGGGWGAGDDGFFVDDTEKHYEAPVCQANIKG